MAPGTSASPTSFAAASSPRSPTAGSGSIRHRKVLGVARQTVLHKVQRGELQAVHVNQGRRKGLRINVNAASPGLFDTPR